MAIDTFTVAQFSAALPKLAGTEWIHLGTIKGEHCWLLKFQGRRPGIFVRSSIRVDGISATIGKDSIRAMLVQDSTQPNRPGVKLSVYTTRRPGWAMRLSVIVGKLTGYINRAGQCPLCSAALEINVSKQVATKKRPFARCPNKTCSHFEWLDEPPKAISRPPVVAPSGPDASKGVLPGPAAPTAPGVDLLAEENPYFRGPDAKLDNWVARHDAHLPPVKPVSSPPVVAPTAPEPVKRVPPAPAPVGVRASGVDTYLEAAQKAAPLCDCKDRDINARARRVVKPGRNHDKIFFNCSRGKSGGCDFFEWFKGDSGPVAIPDASGQSAAANVVPARGEPDPALDAWKKTASTEPCPKCQKAGKREAYRCMNGGANHTRIFVKCKACSDFLWVTPAVAPVDLGPDTEVEEATSNATPCPKCQKQRRAYRVRKPGANNNRVFINCLDRSCDGGFEWLSAGEADAELEYARAMIPPCPTCEKPLVVNRVRKAGENTGKLFSKCEQCGTFAFLGEE